MVVAHCVRLRLGNYKTDQELWSSSQPSHPYSLHPYTKGHRVFVSGLALDIAGPRETGVVGQNTPAV